MATIYASVKGIQLLRESIGGGTAQGLALVQFTMPAYAASSDNGKLGAGGYDRGVATTDTLATMIQKQRRDGKTVTLQDAVTGVAATIEPGRHGATEFWAATFAVSSGSLTFNVTDATPTEIDAASGVSDKPITIAVAYRLT